MVHQSNTSRTKRLPPRLRVFTATLHNYRSKHVNAIKAMIRDKTLNYVIVGFENGDDGDTPHLQIYGQCSKQIRGTTLKKKFKSKRIHIDYRNGTHKQARRYCMKEGMYKEWGLPRLDQSENGEVQIAKTNEKLRERLVQVRELAKTGANFNAILDLDISICARYTRFVDRVMSLAKLPNREGLKVSVHYGPPGSGKTWWCTKDSKGECWLPPIKNQIHGCFWFDGYDGHKFVVLDDFSGKMGLDELLRLLDIYPCMIPVKGGHVHFQATRIYITTNVDWVKWYNYEDRQDSKAALERRIDEFWLHTKTLTGGYKATLCNSYWQPYPFTNSTVPPNVVIDSDSETDIVDDVLGYRFNDSPPVVPGEKDKDVGVSPSDLFQKLTSPVYLGSESVSDDDNNEINIF